MLYPMLLTPALHTRVWGGRRLESELGKTLPTYEPYGESWELHDSAVIANGAYAGRTVGEVLAALGPALVGDGFDLSEGFPLLIKFLDANDWLSVQVHPDDAQARALENQPRGKTEAWVVLDAVPGARLVIGVTPGTDRAAMAQAIAANTLEDLLVYAEVTAGDVLYMAAGTVHALGPGTLIYEVQQSSDLTYRLYDWGRVGLDGQPRPLHIDKGVQVSNVDTTPPISRAAASDSEPIIRGAFFTTYLHRLDGQPLALDTARRDFHALTCTAGTVSVGAGGEALTLQRGDTALIPAHLGAYTLTGSGDVLRSLPARA